MVNVTDNLNISQSSKLDSMGKSFKHSVDNSFNKKSIQKNVTQLR